MSTLCYILLMVICYKVVKAALENDRITKVAKIEAELKLELAKRWKDPELVRRVVESRLPLYPEKNRKSEALPAAEEAARQALHAQRQARAVAEAGLTPQMHRYVLGGLVCFLVGAAMIAGSYIQKETMGVLVLPGLITSAVGFALLSFATSQKHLRKTLGVEDPPPQ